MVKPKPQTNTQSLSSHWVDDQTVSDTQNHSVTDYAPTPESAPLALSTCPHLPDFAFLAVVTEDR